MPIPKINTQEIRKLGTRAVSGITEMGRTVREQVVKKSIECRDKYIKSDATKQMLNKDFVLGSLILLSALMLIGKTILGIKNKLDEMKK